MGTFNLHKLQSAPELVKDFSGKDVYGLSYGIIYDKIKSVLYVTNGPKLMLFSDNNSKSSDHNANEYTESTTAIGVSAMFTTIGFQNGSIRVLSNDDEQKVLISYRLFQMYTHTLQANNHLITIWFLVIRNWPWSRYQQSI